VHVTLNILADSETLSKRFRTIFMTCSDLTNSSCETRYRLI